MGDDPLVQDQTATSSDSLPPDQLASTEIPVQVQQDQPAEQPEVSSSVYRPEPPIPADETSKTETTEEKLADEMGLIEIMC